MARSRKACFQGASSRVSLSVRETNHLLSHPKPRSRNLDRRVTFEDFAREMSHHRRLRALSVERVDGIPHLPLCALISDNMVLSLCHTYTFVRLSITIVRETNRSGLPSLSEAHFFEMQESLNYRAIWLAMIEMSSSYF